MRDSDSSLAEGCNAGRVRGFTWAEQLNPH
jgi:hypothetical protein